MNGLHDDHSTAVSAPTSLDVQAVNTIQNAWRSLRPATTLRLVEAYLSTAPTTERIRDMSFDGLIEFLRNRVTIATTKACLERIQRLAIQRHGLPESVVLCESVNVRVFLSGWMIAFHPSKVFESIGALERALFNATGPLLTAFEAILTHVSKSPGHTFAEVPPNLTADFPTLLFDFVAKFRAWKVPDAARVAHRIRAALFALYQAERQLPADEPPDSRLRADFRSEIERMRSRLEQIAGAEALRRFDEERLNPSGSGEGNGGNGGNGGGGEGGNGGILGMTLPGRTTNDQLAYELLRNPDFRLDPSGSNERNPVAKSLKDKFTAAFWDTLVDDLTLEKACYTRVLRVLAEIRVGIHDLAPTEVKACVCELINLPVIEAAVESGNHSMTDSKILITGIVAVIQRVQMLERENETRTLWAPISKSMDDLSQSKELPRAVVKGLEFLLERVNVMRIDAANKRLGAIWPVIKDHGIGYVRGKFQDRLKDGTLTLEHTKAWIDEAVRVKVGSAWLSLPDLLSGGLEACTEVHAAAVVALISGLPDAKTPETLLLDAFYIQELQREFQYILCASVMLDTTQRHMEQLQDAEALARVVGYFVDADKLVVDEAQVLCFLCVCVFLMLA